MFRETPPLLTLIPLSAHQSETHDGDGDNDDDNGGSGGRADADADALTRDHDKAANESLVMTNTFIRVYSIPLSPSLQ